MDDFLLEKVQNIPNDIKQVVIGAVGLDSRAFRLPWPKGTVVYEIDNKELLDWKEKKINEMNAKPNCERITIPADLASSEWISLLQSKGYRKDIPSIWVYEGLTLYVPEQGVRNLFKNTFELAAKGSWMIFDCMSLVPEASRHPQSAEFKRLGHPLVLGIPHPESFTKSCSWPSCKVVQIGDKEADYGICESKLVSRIPRWFPIPIPRNFLVSCSK